MYEWEYILWDQNGRCDFYELLSLLEKDGISFSF